MDPTIYPQPELFIWDRFLQRQGPNQFSYRGEPLKYNLLPFGGGQSICPGRHFARSEFKILTALLLRQFDIELLDTAIPPHDKSRSGLGVDAAAGCAIPLSPARTGNPCLAGQPSASVDAGRLTSLRRLAQPVLVGRHAGPLFVGVENEPCSR
ncbi:MAG: cytochrome P450 [Gammaproteobacteria bacterium]